MITTAPSNQKNSASTEEFSVRSTVRHKRRRILRGRPSKYPIPILVYWLDNRQTQVRTNLMAENAGGEQETDDNEFTKLGRSEQRHAPEANVSP